MSIGLRRAVPVLTVVMAALALIHAATQKFREKERAITEACRAELQKEGLTAAAAKSKYPTPSISMVSSGCLPPGGTGEIVAKGTFSPGTKFVVENDNIEVVKENLVGSEYHATVKVASGIGPQSAGVTAINPRCMYARSASRIVIGGQFEWRLDAAAKGWSVVARPVSQKACGDQAAASAYEMQFFRKGEAAPFEKGRATLEYQPYNDSYRFAISQEDPAAASSMQDMQAIMQKVMDPKLSQAQRDQLMKQIEQIQARAQADMQKMMDPKYIKQQEEKRAQFGCRSIEVQGPLATLSGTLYCADAAGNRIPVTGAAKYLGQ